MGSANGRHRRPRQAPAIVVAAGVTGSAIAIPLLGAAGAHAADATTWDRVAECESGGMWSADLGNGYYGGLQFSQETWESYGGRAYAPRADLASRSQQISVAEKVLDAKGPQAWPSCAPIAKLTKGGAAPGVDPGNAPSPGATKTAEPGAGRAGGGSSSADDAGTGVDSDAPDAPSASGTPGAGTGASAGPGSSDPSGAASATTPSADGATDGTTGGVTGGTTDPSGAPDASGEAGGKHRGPLDPAESDPARTSDEVTDRDSGRHASRGEGEARDGEAVAKAEDYTVRPGDNLWAIADAQKVPGGWTSVYEANKDTIGADPDLILPGQSLDLEPEAS
ncbi:transglycosylase family protein [Streptomyces sp. AM 4-1-1]|uniref:transglycosylase family protein n=1 Tax=Streptomyces sp. AM 4-1-1 TaxID=3028710 RepID=UPI0023B9FB2E|nr:transglycosylase family protein [Streptomyces sp. AM 4-1-1]WEH33848.1 transglycosylase family protein [Streptomyces sp. AM 4-1-1]